MSNRYGPPTKTDSCCSIPCNLAELDDVPLISLFHSKKHSLKIKKVVPAVKGDDSKAYVALSPQSSSKALGHTRTIPCGKCVRISLSDEEDDNDVVGCSKGATLSSERVATLEEG